MVDGINSGDCYLCLFYH